MAGARITAGAQEYTLGSHGHVRLHSALPEGTPDMAHLATGNQKKEEEEKEREKREKRERFKGC